MYKEFFVSLTRTRFGRPKFRRGFLPFKDQNLIKMPRRSGGGRMSAPRAAPRPAPAPSKPSNVPAQRPASTVAQPAPQQSAKQPGLFAHMASTAAGVAVGSTVGHALGGALTGAFSGGNSSEASQYQEQPAQVAPNDNQYGYQQPQQYQNPCDFELKQFLNCAQNQHDITLCEGFNDALKQCKISKGLY